MGSPTPSERTKRVHIELDKTKWSYQAAKNIVNFKSKKDETFDKGLLGWGDLVLKGSNEKFNGTLGKTPQSNGIGGILDVTGSLKGDILTMRATGSVKCNGTAYEWVYDYYGTLMPEWSTLRQTRRSTQGAPLWDRSFARRPTRRAADRHAIRTRRIRRGRRAHFGWC